MAGQGLGDFGMDVRCSQIADECVPKGVKIRNPARVITLGDACPGAVRFEHCGGLPPVARNPERQGGGSLVCQ